MTTNETGPKTFLLTYVWMCSFRPFNCFLMFVEKFWSVNGRIWRIIYDSIAGGIRFESFTSISSIIIIKNSSNCPFTYQARILDVVFWFFGVSVCTELALSFFLELLRKLDCFDRMLGKAEARVVATPLFRQIMIVLVKAWHESRNVWDELCHWDHFWRSYFNLLGNGVSSRINYHR